MNTTKASAHFETASAPLVVPALWPFKRVYYGWAIVGAALIASFGSVPVFGPVLGVFILPMQEELGWSRATISLGFALGNFTGSATTFTIGSLLDRYGARIIVVATGIIITAAMLGLAAIAEPWQFWLFFGLGRGAALAGVQAGTSVAIANWFVRMRGRALAIKGIGLRVGQAVYPLIIFAIMAASSWRHAYAALAGLALILIVVPSALFLRRRPEDMGLLPDGATSETPLPGAGSRPAAHEESWTLAEARQTRSLWLVMAFTVFAHLALGSINLHMVANFQDKGIPSGLAVSILSLFATSSALTVLPWGLLLERVHVRTCSMLMCALYIVATVIILWADTYPLALAFGVVYGVAHGGWTVIQNLIFADYFGRRHTGAIRGFAAPFRLLGPLGPVATGFIRDVTGGYNLAFTVLAGIFILMLVLLALAPPPKRRPVHSAESDPGRPVGSRS
ncbi:MAG TPA: MFS transporter [Candidatus Binatia bacterium]